MIKDLILKNRSRRRFKQDVTIDMETLKELVDLARCSASGANRQPLKYILSCDPEKNGKIFPNLFWAGALKDWDGPAEGKQPSAYIIILGDIPLKRLINILISSAQFQHDSGLLTNADNNGSATKTSRHK